jgi:tRNA threonylcarbamoyladenosine modification (KEOPS) complex  Pcc1 subunit
MSRRDAIVDDIVTALGAASITLPSGTVVTKPTGLNVHRQRAVPIDTDLLPALAVYQRQEVVDTAPGRGPSRVSRRKMQIGVEVRIDAGATSADQALDSYLRWVVLAVCSDPRRSTLAHDTTELGTEWDQETRSSRLALATTVFLVEYVTSASDIDAAT